MLDFMEGMQIKVIEEILIEKGLTTMEELDLRFKKELHEILKPITHKYDPQKQKNVPGFEGEK